MTIDLRALALALPLVVAGWAAVLGGTLWFSGKAPAVLVMLPPAGLLRALPAGTSVLSAGPYSMTLRGGDGLVAALHRAGARLILPAGLTGCVPSDGTVSGLNPPNSNQEAT